MKNLLLPLLISIALAACAQAPIGKGAATGTPEKLYTKLLADDVRPKLVAACTKRSLVVYEDTPSAVICGKEVSGAGINLVQAVISTGYSIVPVHKIRFSISQTSAGTRVWAESWEEKQMAMGQTSKKTLEDESLKSSIQSLLEEIQ